MFAFRHGLTVASIALLLASSQCAGDAVGGDDEAALEALRIADEVTGEVEGPTTPPAAPHAKPQKQERMTSDALGPVMLQKAVAHAASAHGISHAAPAAAPTTEDDDTVLDGDDAIETVPAATVTTAAQAAVDAENAHIAADTAKHAAEVATTVAKHSIKLKEHAKSALKDAHDALHRARVETQGLSQGQKESLKVAEGKLREATKDAEYGKAKNAKYIKAKDQKMEDKMEKIKQKADDDELEAMRQEVKQLRDELNKKEGQKSDDDEVLQDLQDQLEKMQAAEKKEGPKDKKSHDEMKAEIERLRDSIREMENDSDVPNDTEQESPRPESAEKQEAESEPLKREQTEADAEEERAENGDASPVESKGLDIDTAMPYGDLEPFGREDTAQELTENSISESNAMVDQLERAAVAEEKRAVFRALTRLRGAAITSFDGIARSQTGQIDEYNKMHKWRRTHPLHHLADEESDVSKWAFPENADF